ncbi:hypothetical protein ACH4E8_29365 [Streptomyces sp. NPDC017979]|uniref:hypothetical protein n=1 Tax=Streptomyces sp. NPDC017979 TaxID=3365024 RepID=UPI0037A14916
MTAPDPRDQHTADLRAALTTAKAWLSFSAGMLAADHPDHAEQQMEVAEQMTRVLDRTAPGNPATAGTTTS